MREATSGVLAFAAYEMQTGFNAVPLAALG
jgi:hypothetical protein